MGIEFAPQLSDKTVSEVANAAVSFGPKLRSGELLTGTPTVAEITTTGLTISNVAVSTAIEIINGVSTAVGEAVLFKVVGGSASTTHKIKITVTTDSTPAQTFVRGVKLLVLPDPA